MLILTRRVGEKLRIGDDITIEILDMKSNQVRIGIDAPRNVSVHREEVYLRIQEQKQAEQEEEIYITQRTVVFPQTISG